MLIETAAYASRWRTVAPSAKALFALTGMAAAVIANVPATLALVAATLFLAAVLGAAVPVRVYLKVALAPLGFLLLSCLTMLVGPDHDGVWRPHTAMLPTVARTALRSLAMLAALLGLVLTTPLPDLLALLRRVHAPALLLDLMVLCYRMLFVLRQSWEEGVAAQTARLGYCSVRSAWRSTGLLVGQMAMQLWQRASALQMAAEARNYQGTLRFLPAPYPNARQHNLVALAAGAVLMLVAMGGRW